MIHAEKNESGFKVNVEGTGKILFEELAAVINGFIESIKSQLTDIDDEEEFDEFFFDLLKDGLAAYRKNLAITDAMEKLKHEVENNGDVDAALFNVLDEITDEKSGIEIDRERVMKRVMGILSDASTDRRDMH